MPLLRESVTLPIERNILWTGPFATEPAEAAWAAEAIFFIRALKVEGKPGSTLAQVQISPDGMHWCDEGTTFPLPAVDDTVTFGRVSHFGGWLRLVGEMPPGAALTVIVYLVLKG
ncbi:MAG: hypothetical protein K8J31_05985 [Anaerolineae bacterium]|nr:hypothetical protein [Anaerolineae bacterium]